MLKDSAKASETQGCFASTGIIRLLTLFILLSGVFLLRLPVFTVSKLGFGAHETMEERDASR